MRVARNGLGYRILLPIFLLVAGLTVALLLLVQRITRQVSEDYQRFTVTASAGQVSTILELAAAELTAAKLERQPGRRRGEKGRRARGDRASSGRAAGSAGSSTAADGAIAALHAGRGLDPGRRGPPRRGVFHAGRRRGGSARLRAGVPALGVDRDHGRPPHPRGASLRPELVLLLPLLGARGAASWPPASSTSSGATCAARSRRWSPPSTASARCRRPGSRSSTASAGR